MGTGPEIWAGLVHMAAGSSKRTSMPCEWAIIDLREQAKLSLSSDAVLLKLGSIHIARQKN